MDKVKGFKTVVFGVLIGATAVFSNADMQAFFAEYLEWIGGMTGTAIVILRALTASPIFMKKPSE